jgi:hypothetical protein
LGIDFGTSFTKICFRDQAIDHSSLVNLDGGQEGALLPSVVHVDDAGTLHIGRPASSSTKSVRYLKMRLAGVPLDGLLGDELRGADDADVCKALSSWFLATVIVRSRTWILQHHADRVRNRRVDWSANLGVPVEHYDSPLLKIFEEVLGVAWQWCEEGDVPKSLATALEGYKRARQNKRVADFHPVPEIAAAVQSFVISQAATPGVYLYFDVGGGTVDGVAFRLRNDDGQKQVDFYSGRVSPLGTISLLRHLEPDIDDGDQSEGRLEQLLATNRPGAEELEHAMRLLVANVVMTAKQKDGRNWRAEAIQQWAESRNVRTFGRPASEKPVVVFIGGGGARIAWYGKSILSTHGKFKHNNAGIPPYSLRKVPKPADVTLPDVDPGLFDRFSIAYGLSIPMGTGPDIRLPSQFDPPAKNEPRRPPGIGDYLLNSKDAWE